MGANGVGGPARNTRPFFPAAAAFHSAALATPLLPPRVRFSVASRERLARTVITDFESRPRILRARRESRDPPSPSPFPFPPPSPKSPASHPLPVPGTLKRGGGNARHTNRMEINKCLRGAAGDGETGLGGRRVVGVFAPGTRHHLLSISASKPGADLTNDFFSADFLAPPRGIARTLFHPRILHSPPIRSAAPASVLLLRRDFRCFSDSERAAERGWIPGVHAAAECHGPEISTRSFDVFPNVSNNAGLDDYRSL